MTTDIKKIAIFYGHVASNLGDLAINLGTLSLLRRAYPGAVLRFVFLDAEKSRYLPMALRSLESEPGVEIAYFTAGYDKALTYQTRPAAFLEACGAQDVDLIVLASSEHLFRYAHGGNDKSLYWRTLPALAALAGGKRSLILPSTFGPFEDDGSTALVSSLLAMVGSFATREVASARLLGDHFGIAPPANLLDPAFFLKPPRKASPPSTANRPCLGLAMRSEAWGIRLPKEVKQAATDELAAQSYRSSEAFRFSMVLCREFLESLGGTVHLFVQTEADDALAQDVRAALSEVGHGDNVMLSRPESVDDYLTQVARLELMVASRFHAVILALVAKVPAFGTYFDVHGHKMSGLFELLGATQRCVSISRESPESAARKVLEVFGTNADGVETLRPQIERLEEETVTWLARAPDLAEKNTNLLRAIEAYGEFSSLLVRQGFAAATKKQTQSLSTKLTETRSQVSDVESLLAKARSQVDDLRRQLAEARSQAKLDSERIARLAQDVMHAREEAGRLQEHLASARARMLQLEDEARELASMLQRIRSSVLYKASNELRQAIREPSRFPKLPFKVFTLYRDSRRKRRAQGDLSAADISPSDTRLETDQSRAEELLAVPPQQVLHQVRQTAGSPSAAALQLAKLSKHFSDHGRQAEGCELAQMACDLAPSEGAYRALFWALQKAGRIDDACATIQTLEAFLGEHPSPKQAERLRKLKSQPPYQLTARDLVGPRSERASQHVPNRAAYVLHNSLPYSSGGYAIRAQGLARGLQGLGFEVVGLTRPGYPIDVKPELDPHAVSPADVVEDVRYIRSVAPSRKQHAFRDFISLAADTMEAHFREQQPEIVIAASNYICALPALIAARRLGLDFIYEVRGFWEITRLSRQPNFIEETSYLVQEAMEAFVCTRADAVVTLTASMQAELVRRGVAASTIHVIPNACEPERFYPRPRDSALAAKHGIPDGVPVIGYVGTFVDYEGLDDLTRACALLKQRGLTFRLLLVGNENTSGSGEGPIAREIRSIAALADLSRWLVMPGRVSHDLVAAYYSLIDIAPFPRKPWPVCEMVSPMKPLEALAMEKTVVVSSVAALADIVHDSLHGLVFTKGDVNSLAEALAKAIASPELRQSLGRRGRDYVLAERTWAHSAKTLATVLESLGRHPVTTTPPTSATPCKPLSARNTPTPPSAG